MGNVAQVVVDTHAVGRRKVGQEVLAQLHLDVAALGDLDGVGNRLGQVAEQLGHFLRAFQVLLVAVVTRTARIVQGPAFTDAHAGFVGVEVGLLDKAYIVGRHQRRAQLVGQGHGGVQVFFVTGAVGALHLDVEALREHLQPVAQQRFGFIRVAIEQRHADVAFLCRGQGNQPLAGLNDPLALDDHQAIALAIDPAAGNQLGKVAVALGVHGQQADARQRCIRVAVGQPQVGTADRLDTGAHGVLVELDQRAHVALVGNRYGRHVHRGQCLGQRLDPHQAIDQGEFGVQA
ncbi:hypothetical protein D3C79_639160 [compost metagenome]